MRINLPEKDIKDGILEGVIDLHCHAGPCIFEKSFDEIEIAKQMRDLGYRGVLFKQHLLGANRIALVRKAVPGLEIFGGITLNHFVGGLNPLAVSSAVAFGAKEVKMPNMHSAYHIKTFGAPTYTTITQASKVPLFDDNMGGITIFDEKGEILPVVYKIIDLVVKNDLILSTGHLSPEESLELIKVARTAGLKKMVVTHANWGGDGLFPPLFPPNGIPLDVQKKMVDEGAYIEYCYVTNSITLKQQKLTAKYIKTVGASNCIMSTDAGTEGMIHPIEAFRLFIKSMRKQGISQEDIDEMTKDNPAKLLGI